MSSASKRLNFADGQRSFTAEPETNLLAAMKSELGLDAPPRGCRDGSCGSCRVLIDGQLLRACQLTLGGVADGAVVLLARDVAQEPLAARAVTAFNDERPTRCELCVGAVAITAAFLARQPASARGAQLPVVLAQASCACTGIGSWRRALNRAVRSTER